MVMLNPAERNNPKPFQGCNISVGKLLPRCHTLQRVPGSLLTTLVKCLWLSFKNLTIGEHLLHEPPQRLTW